MSDAWVDIQGKSCLYAGTGHRFEADTSRTEPIHVSRDLLLHICESLNGSADTLLFTPKHLQRL